MPNARLTVTDPFGSRVWPIDKLLTTIGRRATCDVQFDKLDVSKSHAEIVHDRGTYVLRDCGSTYGTFVNGERITAHTLRSGDHIRLSKPGSVELLFEIGNPADSTLNLSSGVHDFRQLAAVMDGLRALSSGRVLEDVLTLVIDAALDTTMADRGFIMLADDRGELQFRIARRRGGVTLSDASFLTSVKIPRDVFAGGRPKVFDDLDLSPADHEATRAFGIRRVICVPLRITPVASAQGQAPSDRVIGVLYLDQTIPARSNARGVLESVEAFATQAALAIESARLYGEAAEKARLDRDLRVAADIQRTLLGPPSYSGATCQLAAFSVPCRTIGGDFYDYLETDDGRFGFALGDVAGKGPPAALLAAALQTNFVAYASLGGDAARTTARINAALLRRPIEARFATMFLGVLTPGGELTYCSAGHEPPFVLAGDGGVRSLEAGGAVLGLFSHARYTSETIQLSPGDLLVVCSDGVTEAANPNGEEFGRARVVETVAACSDRKAETVLDCLVGAVRQFAQDMPQADDITVVVINVGKAAE